MKMWIFRGIGIALFVYLLVGVVEQEALLQALKTIPLLTFALIIPLHLSQWLLRALRFQFILKRFDIRMPLHHNLCVSLTAFFLGCLTPGRLGEFAKVRFLMNHHASFRDAFLASLQERLQDLATLLLFVACATLFLVRELPWQALAAVGGCVLLGTAAIRLFFARNLLYLALRKLIPQRIANSVEDKSELFFASFRSYPRSALAGMTLCSVGIWGLNYVMIYLLFRGTGADIPLLHAIAFASLGSLAGLIPLSVYGVGIREALLIPLFLTLPDFTRDPETAAFTFGLMYLVVLLYHIVLGGLAWLSPWMKPYAFSGTGSSSAD